MSAEERPAEERLAWRAAGFAIFLAGATLLAWSVWRGSRPVGGLERAEGEWLVPAPAHDVSQPAAPSPAGPSPALPSSATPSSAPQDQAARASIAAPGAAGAAPAPPPVAHVPADPMPLVIDINRATAAQLELLPDIGPTLAERIVADRDANGPFTAPEDLLRVRGIGDKTLAGIRPFITCGTGGG